MQCPHEDSCGHDPCETLTAPDRNARTFFDVEMPSVSLQVVTWNTELASAMWSWSSRPPLPPDRWNLPYAQSDRPLLI
jgi:hypothetical protein